MYKHTQIGWYIYFLVIPAILVLGIFSAITSTAYPLIVGIVLVAALVMFGALTVVADDNRIGFYFGPGIIRKNFRYGDIDSATQVRNHWLMGWGVRYFGHGWLYNVSGLDAVELKLKSGKVLRIGTDEPERLMSFLRTKMGR